MKAVTYTIKLLEPILATQPHSGEANSRTSFLYIPGSMIRGALIRAFAKSSGDDDLVAENHKARPLFFGDDVFFLNAYPAHPHHHPDEPRRMLPTPRSWFVEKGEEDELEIDIQNYANGEYALLNNPKSPGSEFCFISDSTTFLKTPKRQLTVHNASDDPSEKREGKNQVFRYEALAAGERFVGAIISENESKLQEMQRLLKNSLITFGGSHTGGYGRVDIIVSEEIADWQEYEKDASEENDIIVLTLLSDAILRCPDNGHVSASIAQFLLIDTENEEEIRTFAKTQLMGGFNRKWGLPLPQEWGLAAGSVFCLPESILEKNKLNEIEKYGIGERRLDGYGRVAVNWNTDKEYKRIHEDETADDLDQTLTQSSLDLLQKMAQRHLRKKLEYNLKKKVASYRNSFKNLPSASQLSRVRLAARTAALKEDATIINQHMKSIKGAKDEWEEARISGRNLYNWVEKTSLMSTDKFHEEFGLNEDEAKIAGITADVSQNIQQEYIARLIDGVMKFAIEKRKDDDEKGAEQ